MESTDIGVESWIDFIQDSRFGELKRESNEQFA
jgi:hypothetical protein